MQPPVLTSLYNLSMAKQNQMYYVNQKRVTHAPAFLVAVNLLVSWSCGTKKIKHSPLSDVYVLVGWAAYIP